MKKISKPLLEICLFGSKINISYQIKFTLNLRYIYLIHINHSFTPKIKHVIRRNVGFGKCPFGDVPFGELSFWGIFHLENCSFEEPSLGELSVGEMSFGNCPSEKSLLGKNPSGKCPNTFWNIFCGTP